MNLDSKVEVKLLARKYPYLKVVEIGVLKLLIRNFLGIKKPKSLEYSSDYWPIKSFGHL